MLDKIQTGVSSVSVPVFDGEGVYAEPPEPTMEETIATKRDALIIARDQARMQLNGLENQIYILEQLLNPTPQPALPDAEEAQEPPADIRPPLEPGTI